MTETDPHGEAGADDALVWYFDLVSPFAWLALPEVEALAREHPVRFRPVVFGALLAHWGQLGPAEIAPKRLHTYRLCQFIAERNGIPLRFPPRHPFRSLEALRLLTALEARPEAVREVGGIWAILDARLATRPWIAGSDFTLADVAYAPHVHRWFNMQFEGRPEAPHLRAWYDRLLARPAYKQHCAITIT